MCSMLVYVVRTSTSIFFGFFVCVHLCVCVYVLCVVWVWGYEFSLCLQNVKNNQEIKTKQNFKNHQIIIPLDVMVHVSAFHPYEKLYMDAHGSFTQNCQHSNVTEIPFSR